MFGWLDRLLGGQPPDPDDVVKYASIEELPVDDSPADDGDNSIVAEQMPEGWDR